MKVTKTHLRKLGVKEKHIDLYLKDLRKILPEHGIDTELRVAHFLAQVMHESGNMRVVKENMNYSAERLRKVFGKYFKTDAKAAQYARKPKAIGSYVYANRGGNGGEESGDGFRYRGRGLIQLTFRGAYKKFGKWVGDDVIATPGLVAEKYAVHSAVYFWDLKKLNTLADTDDITRITKKVNGSTRSVPERLKVLDKVKEALKVADSAVLDRVTHTVVPLALNFRSRPVVSPSTRIAVLSEGTEVEKIADASKPNWCEIHVVIDGYKKRGFVSEKCLTKFPGTTPPPPPTPLVAIEPEPSLPIVHLKVSKKTTRKRDGRRAYPLGESQMPKRNQDATDSTRVKQLLRIAEYLDPESEKHQRYQRKPKSTYCNIYAYDFSCLAGAFLPRVWWTPKALRRIDNGREVTPKYGETVRELNANSLHDWFEDHGPSFGWQRVFDLDVLQGAANNGEVCIIVAKKKELNRSGHITAVVPEQPGFEAVRNAAGEVLRPVESQAGAKNHRFVVKTRQWWNSDSYQSFLFFRHA